MVEWLVAKLAYSPLFRSLFSTLPRIAAESNPAVQQAILTRAEQAVYGDEGLQAYEAGVHSGLERSARRCLAQHLCQRALRGSRAVNRIRDLIGALSLLPLLSLFMIASLRFRRTAPGTPPDLVVFFWYERLYKFIGSQAFPVQSYALHRGHQVYFSYQELEFLLRAVAAYPRLLAYPELLCNLLRWLGYYGYAVHHYQPRKAVVHFCEGVASVSLITGYLHQKGLKHIDVQHGELYFVTRSAFCHFDEIRVWGEHFRHLFLRNRSPQHDVRVVGVPHYRVLFTGLRDQFQPRPPRLLVLDPFLYRQMSLYESLMRAVLQRLDGSWEVRVRRHPAELRSRLKWMDGLNGDPVLLQRGISLAEELPSLPIEDALAKSRVVLGVASGAMIEAWIAGCKVMHLAGGPCPGELMGRYRGSENVMYFDGTGNAESLDRFLFEPARLDEHEARRVNHLVTMTGDAA